MPSARIRVNSHLRPYETSPFPAIQDISVSGHTRHLRLQPYVISPSPANDSTSPAMDQSRPEPFSPVQVQSKKFLDWDRLDWWNQCLQPYKTTLSPAIRDSSPAEACMCNNGQRLRNQNIRQTAISGYQSRSRKLVGVAPQVGGLI